MAFPRTKTLRWEHDKYFSIKSHQEPNRKMLALVRHSARDAARTVRLPLFSLVLFVDLSFVPDTAEARASSFLFLMWGDVSCVQGQIKAARHLARSTVGSFLDACKTQHPFPTLLLAQCVRVKPSIRILVRGQYRYAICFLKPWISLTRALHDQNR